MFGMKGVRFTSRRQISALELGVHMLVVVIWKYISVLARFC
jgi:hypothetical protein